MDAEPKKKEEAESEKKEASPEELAPNTDDYIIQEPEDSEMLQPEMATINYAVISFCRYLMIIVRLNKATRTKFNASPQNSTFQASDNLKSALFRQRFPNLYNDVYKNPTETVRFKVWTKPSPKFFNCFND
eukprot:UN14777